MDGIEDPYAKEFAYMQYGAWDRLDDNRPFLAGYEAKPAPCHYYPQDITEEEFNKRMTEYKQTLTEQFAESHRLENEIMKHLDSLKFNN